MLQPSSGVFLLEALHARHAVELAELERQEENAMVAALTEAQHVKVFGLNQQARQKWDEPGTGQDQISTDSQSPW